MRKIYSFFSVPFLVLFVMILFVMAGVLKVRADEKPAVKAQPAHAKWFDGNWYDVKGYACPDKKDKHGKVIVDNSAGRQAYQEVKAQSAAYREAKAKGDLAGIVANSYWDSCQAWGYNNAAHRLIAGITDKINSDDTQTRAKQAKDLLLKAQDILSNAVDLPVVNDNHGQESAFNHEKAERQACQEKVDANLLYVKRLLGEEPWPEVKKSDSSDDGQ